MSHAFASEGAPVFCIAENRANCEPALRVLVSSLQEHSPLNPISIFVPNATDEFLIWIKKFDNIQIYSKELPWTWNKYDIKPKVLLSVLEGGADSVIWIDSDIVATADLVSHIGSVHRETIVLTEEALSLGRDDTDAARTRGWGMEVGRTLPFGANTAIVRVTPAHRELLKAWDRLLESDEYRNAQNVTWDKRPIHCLGDQEVLTALLCSKAYADVPLRMLRRGRDIIQYFGSSGYTIRERIGNIVRGLPPLIHSQAFRPWWPRASQGDGGRASSRFLRLYQELSPYVLYARRYRDALPDPWWLTPPTRLARAMFAMSFGHPALLGMPLALIADARRLFKLGITWVRRRAAR